MIKYKSSQELLDLLKVTYNHKFKEYDVNNRLSNPNNKGVLGHIVEEGIFKYPINSNPKADFDYLGIELKTAGLLIDHEKHTFRAKERLPLNSLNYFEVVNKSFEESAVWNKSKSILFVLYEYLENVFKGDFKIMSSLLHSFTDKDMLLFEKDYNFIVNKIKQGKAHEISESDTMYLGACTSGRDAKSVTKQPYSNQLAKRRKFAFKQSYITQIFQSHLGVKRVLENALSDDELKTQSFDRAFIKRMKPYFNKTDDELCNRFNISPKTKNKMEIIIARILGIKGSVNDTEEFVKSNMELKTIRLEPNGKIIQSMSFPAFKFTDIVSQDWENSDFRQMLVEKRFVFAIFKNVGGKYVFSNVKFWNPPLKDIDNKGLEVFNELKKVIKAGNIVKGFKTLKNGKIIRQTNFPGMSFNGFIHIRPHGKDSKDVYPLPIKDKLTHADYYTKQCFWFNNSYIAKVIK